MAQRVLVLALFAVTISCDPGTEPVSEPTPTNVVLVSGDAQTAEVGIALSQPLVVRVTDGLDRAVPDVVVTWTLSGGSVSPADSRTGQDGIASVQWTLGEAAGAATATASVSNITPVEFAATANPGPPASVAVEQESVFLNAIGGTAQLTASAADRFDNAVAGPEIQWKSLEESVATVDASGLVTATANGEARIVASSGDAADTAAVLVRQAAASVTVAAASSTDLDAVNATIQLDATAVDAGGHPASGVTFTWTSNTESVVTVDGSGLVTAVSNGSATIRAAADGASGSITVTVEQVATQVDFAVGPVNSSVDQPFPELQVEVLDANGHVAQNFDDAVTISIGTNPHGGNLSGEFTSSAAAGVATFPDLALDGAGADYTLVASAGALSNESQAFNVTLPSAYVTTQSSDAVSVIATSTDAFVASITVGSSPFGMAVHPDGTFGWVTNNGSSTISVIDIPGHTVTQTLTAPGGPVGLAFSPDGATAYVATFSSNTVSVFDVAGGTVSATVSVGSGPIALAVVPAPVP